MNHLNLVTDPWVPVLRNDGKLVEVGLLELFEQAKTLRDLSAMPHERIALYRLLICIAQAALDGPADRYDWEECKESIIGKSLAYLEKWKDAFNLFGDGARFLQVRSGEDASNFSLSKLNFFYATGNNTTLYDNVAEKESAFSGSLIALWLVAFQSFSPLIGQGYKGRGPCVDNNAIHAFLRGDTLMETIYLNLLTKEDVSVFYGENAWGKPSWECGLDEWNHQNTLLGYLPRLVPQKWKIWIADDLKTMSFSNGVEYPSFPEYREPHTTVVAIKDGLKLLPVNLRKSAWRELPALVIRRVEQGASSGPVTWRKMEDFPSHELWCGGVVSDFKAKIIEGVESVFALPKTIWEETGRIVYHEGVHHAEFCFSRMEKAVEAYAKSLFTEIDFKTSANASYWRLVESRLALLFDLLKEVSSIPVTSDFKRDFHPTPWGKACSAAAREAYERACPHDTPRQIQAFAHGLKQLRPQIPSQKTAKKGKKQA